MKLFFKCNLLSLSFSPSKAVITKSSKDGIDNLSSLTTYQKETTFSNEVIYDSSTFNTNEPIRSLAYSFPMSIIGLIERIQIGL